MTNLEEIADALREVLSSMEDEIERLAKPPIKAVPAPRPKPHEIASVSAPLHLIQFDDGMWEATSPVIQGLCVQSADKTKLIETLVPEAIRRLVGGK